jgi:1-deoxy-D-xylulose-5-phosphate reductoisomerase
MQGYVMSRKKICVIGATGSIGSATLAIVRQFPEKFEVVGLGAHSRVEDLQRLVEEFSVPWAACTGISCCSEWKKTSRLLVGESAAQQLIEASDPDLVISAIVGIAGLAPTFYALNAGIDVLLANKESLVCAGELIKRMRDNASLRVGRLIPADSEHSSLDQLLHRQGRDQVRSLVLTASGGPFLHKPLSELKSVTPRIAVAHPTWQMGPKISVDSATMVNKALEVIEAYWLFEVDLDQIDVIIHPQSIVHALVEFHDGAIFAHLSTPDMRGPLSYGLGIEGQRLPNVMRPLRLADVGALTFLQLDNERFPAIALARQCVERGGTAPAIFNCANEEAVELFLQNELRFVDIVPFIEETLQCIEATSYGSVEDLVEVQMKVASLKSEIVRRCNHG